MAESDLALMLVKDRAKFNKDKPLDSLPKPVSMTDINDSINSMIFPSLAKCIEHYRYKGLSVHEKTLTKHIKTGEAYHGYIFKYV